MPLDSWRQQYLQTGFGGNRGSLLDLASTARDPRRSSASSTLSPRAGGAFAPTAVTGMSSVTGMEGGERPRDAAPRREGPRREERREGPGETQTPASWTTNWWDMTTAPAAGWSPQPTWRPTQEMSTPDWWRPWVLQQTPNAWWEQDYWGDWDWGGSSVWDPPATSANSPGPQPVAPPAPAPTPTPPPPPAPTPQPSPDPMLGPIAWPTMDLLPPGGDYVSRGGHRFYVLPDGREIALPTGSEQEPIQHPGATLTDFGEGRSFYTVPPTTVPPAAPPAVPPGPLGPPVSVTPPWNNNAGLLGLFGQT
jgi:hypothetical protein